MKKLYSKVLILVMLIVFSSSSYAHCAPKTVKQIINFAKYGTVIVKTYKGGQFLGHGSGFFITPKTIVTNYHVIEGGNSFIVRTYDKEEYKVKKIIALDASYDIAVLELTGAPKNIKVLTMADIMPEQGDDVLVIGAPIGLDYTVTRGIVTAIRDMERNGTCIQIDASISPGNSGGPVLNDQSEVIGIATFFLPGSKDAPAQNLNFAVSVQYVKYLLNMGYKKFATNETYERALEYYRAGEDEKAIPLFKPYAESHPDNTDAWYYLGMSYYYTGKYENSLECFKHVVRIDKNDSASYNYIALNLINLKRYQEALNACDTSIEINPSNSNAATAYNNKGVCYYETGKYYDAIDYYKQALELKPASAMFLNSMGLAYEGLKEYDNAIKCYNKAIKISPNDPKAYYNLGYLYYNDRQDDMAAKFFARVIKLDSAFTEAYYHLGNIFYDKKDYKTAREFYEKTIDLNPYKDLAYTGAGVCILHLGDSQTAIKYFLKSIEIYKDNSEAFYWLGVAYLNIGDRESALKAYEFLRKLDAKSAKTLYEMINKR